MKYKREVQSDGEWTDEIYPNFYYKLCCCDCGLVHDIQFEVWRVKGRKIIKLTKSNGVLLPHTEFELHKKLDKRTHQVGMKVKRNNRATAQVRRYMKEK